MATLVRLVSFLALARSVASVTQACVSPDRENYDCVKNLKEAVNAVSGKTIGGFKSKQIKATHGKCLDASQRNKSGGKVQMWECNDNRKNQQWTYTAATGQIKATHGKCLDASQRNINGGKVQMWECNDNSKNQQWSESKFGFDWTQCKSEGGQKNCARCKGNRDGALPCNATMYGGCRDDKLWQGERFFLESGEAPFTAKCFKISIKFSGFFFTTYNFPAISTSHALPEGNMVLTKFRLSHPHKASKDVGVFIFKRVVTHKCTGARSSACEKNDEVADVMKVGYCIKCPPLLYRRKDCNLICSVFGSTQAGETTDEQKMAFLTQCMPTAFDAKGMLKKKFKCDGEDLKFAKAEITGF